MKKLVVTFLLACTAVAVSAQTLLGESLSIAETEVAQDGGFIAIVGKATNTSGGPIGNAFVKINLFDAQGTLIGNTMAYASNIAAGQTWRFKAPITVREVASYKVVEVLAYK